MDIHTPGHSALSTCNGDLQQQARLEPHILGFQHGAKGFGFAYWMERNV